MSHLALIPVALLALTSAPVATKAPPPVSASVAEARCTVLPGLPRDVRSYAAGASIVVTWKAPASVSCTPLGGYIVLSEAAAPAIVDAATHRVTLPASAGPGLYVASFNDVGCSLRVDAVPAAKPQLARR